MFGVAMGGVGRFHQIALLRPRGHPGRRTDALHVDDDGRNLGVIRQAQKFIHERDAWARRGCEGARSVPGRSNHHADGAQLVLGLQDAKVVLSGLRVLAIFLAEFLEGIHAGCGWRDRIPRGHGSAGINAAQCGRCIAVDQDLVVVGVHLLQLKRQRALQMLFGVIVAQAQGLCVRFAHGFLGGELFIQELLHHRHVDVEQRD